MRKISIVLQLIFIVSLVASPVAHAAIFPDVPDGHVYQEPIEALSRAQVIKGNPDGHYYPDRPVNRAEMLTLLYRAKGKTPDPTSADCFPDVYGWFESVVCDASANRYIEGYSNGNFRPGNLVNRVEALKMISAVFGFNVENVSDEDRDAVKFVDTSSSAWYTKYLYAAFSKGILPIAGQDGSRFYPDLPLLRGEAAAYIFNALGVKLNEDREEIEESIETDDDDQGTQNQGSSTEQEEVATEQFFDKTFPFNANGKFSKKKSTTYNFDISQTTVVSTEAMLQSGQPGGLSCRLYLINDEGFSHQYFLGFEGGSKCSMLTALSPGSYQLQLQPTSADTTFSVETKVVTGDSNDGFSQAINLSRGKEVDSTLASSDLEDWYRFTISTDTTMTATVSPSAEIRCIIYAMADVDLYGFSGPQCGQSYRYPPGTYYVSIGREKPKTATQTYSVILQ